ncbi:MAG TPA: SURF1 family cytochrome oxidase biogenesis protein [Caulobacteraceae bacterium]|nr:SURF1 family cytochrome oxidase biogenesis protein [Caulobacteraceae bacterium]
MRRLPIGLTVATAIAFAILVALGVWQMQRLAWKRDVMQRIEAAQTAQAAPLNAVLSAAAAGEDVNYRKVVGVCPGLSTAPYAELYALMDGKMGSRLISVCRLEGGPYGSILVDRGFVDAAISSRPPEDPADTRPIGVRGVLRAADEPSPIATPDDPAHRRFFSRRIETLAAHLKAPNPAPYFLMAESSSNPEWKALKPAPLPVNVSNRHLEYALTWFGLAGVLLAVYGAMLRGRGRD